MDTTVKKVSVIAMEFEDQKSQNLVVIQTADLKT